jgi:hypothetical protein
MVNLELAAKDILRAITTRDGRLAFGGMSLKPVMRCLVVEELSSVPQLLMIYTRYYKRHRELDTDDSQHPSGESTGHSCVQDKTSFRRGTSP